MKRTLMMTAALIFAGHMASAAITTDSVVTDLMAQGYTRIEIKQGPTQLKVEAIRGTEKLEVVYDTETGAVLKQEVETVRPGENIAPGVSIRDRNEDFVGSNDDDDDGNHNGDDDDSDNSGHGGDNDNSDDDDGDDNGGDDNGGDDNGGDDNGGDDNGSDDNGGDDNGSDDNGGDDD